MMRYQDLWLANDEQTPHRIFVFPRTGAKVPNVPRWKEIPNYPVISAISVLLIGVTVAWWTGANISPLFENAEIRRGQLWRLATSVLPHLDILHLTFNLYWLWVLGTTVERLCGHFRTMLLVLLFAISSGSLDYALEQGGVEESAFPG